MCSIRQAFFVESTYKNRVRLGPMLVFGYFSNEMLHGGDFMSNKQHVMNVDLLSCRPGRANLQVARPQAQQPMAEYVVLMLFKHHPLRVVTFGSGPEQRFEC